MAFGGQRAPELFSVTSLILILLLAAAMAIRMGLDRDGAWWVAAFLSTMPALYRGLYGGMVDVIYAAFVIAASRIIFDTELATHSTLTGFFCGFAMGTKYTGLVSTILLIISAVVCKTGFTRAFSREFRRHLVTICLVALIVAAPWYIRNWVLLGCPIYPPPPLLFHLFQIKYFPSEAIVRLHDLMSAAGRGMGRGPVSLLMLPFHLTFHPANFESGAGGIGLVPLTFIPFCFYACSWNEFAKKSALFGVLQSIFWFFTMQESRYLIQVYVLAAIFGVAGWRCCSSCTAVWTLLSVLTIMVSVSYGLFMIIGARLNDIHAAVSPSFAESRRHVEIPFWKVSPT